MRQPARECERKLKLLETVTASTTLIAHAEPDRNTPRSDTAEPARTKLRRESEEAASTKPTVDNQP